MTGHGTERGSGAFRRGGAVFSCVGLTLLVLASALEAPTATASSARAGRGFYFVQRDERRCAFPRCGGYWVRLVNHKRTRCGDGARRRRCYVREIDWTRIWEDEATAADVDVVRGADRGSVVLEGRLLPGSGRPGGASFRALSAWWSASAVPARERLFRVTEAQEVCVVAPRVARWPGGEGCSGPTRGRALNRRRRVRLDRLDLAPLEGTPEQVLAAGSAAREGKLLVAGRVVRELSLLTFSGGGRPVRTLRAAQIFLPFD